MPGPSCHDPGPMLAGPSGRSDQSSRPPASHSNDIARDPAPVASHAVAERPHSELLAHFVSESPTPWHAAAGAARILDAAGFAELDATRPFGEVPDRGFVLREGSLVAWDGLPGVAEGRVRSIGAHTDSPGLRIRPRPDIRSAATNQLAVEVYGGALVNSWLDRDLTIAGRVVLADGDAPGGQRVELVHPAGPVARVPQLAIHLDREVNTAGLKLNPQQHLTPLWGLSSTSRGDLRAWLGELVGPGADVLGWDLCLVDTQRPELLGESRELLCSPRLDDLACCWGAIVALRDSGSGQGSNVVVLNDHEEVGSSSSTGAAGATISPPNSPTSGSCSNASHRRGVWTVRPCSRASLTRPSYRPTWRTPPTPTTPSATTPTTASSWERGR